MAAAVSIHYTRPVQDAGRSSLAPPTNTAKSRSNSGIDSGLARFSITAQHVAAVAQTLIRWGGAVGIALLAYKAVAVLAGQQTGANIVIQFLSSITTSNILGLGVGAAGVTYGIGQKRLRERTIERMEGRTASLELELDPKRTTSGLTRKGKTNPKDKS